MNSRSAILIAAVMCLAAAPVGALGANSDGIWQAGKAPGLTRFERTNSASSEINSDPVLHSLDDEQAGLLDAGPANQPILEQLVAPIPPADLRQALSAAPVAAPALSAEEVGRLWPQAVPLEQTAPAVVLSIIGVTIAFALRKQLFALVNRLVLMSVVAVQQPGATISSKPRRRRCRRRRGSRRGSPDISWYFKAVRAPSRSRSSGRRRRWTSTLHPREYVVTDVVYATAPAAAPQPTPRYLLTHSAN